MTGIDRRAQSLFIPPQPGEIWIDDETGQIVEIATTGRYRSREHSSGEPTVQARRELPPRTLGRQLALDFTARVNSVPQHRTGCRSLTTLAMRQFLPRGGTS
jgi:hypothetical protein